MKILTLFICLTILARPVLPVAEYVIDYDYISQVLCINKEKPQMQCKGKCHLMKELAAASENEKPLSSDKKPHFEVHHDWIDAMPTTNIPTPVVSNFFISHSVYRNFYCNPATYPVFHPPATA